MFLHNDQTEQIFLYTYLWMICTTYMSFIQIWELFISQFFSQKVISSHNTIGIRSHNYWHKRRLGYLFCLTTHWFHVRQITHVSIKGKEELWTYLHSHCMFISSLRVTSKKVVFTLPWKQRQNISGNFRISVELTLIPLRRLATDFPPRWPRFDPRSGHVGFIVDKVSLGQVFLLVLRFPLPILIPLTAPDLSSSITWGWYNRPNSGWSTKWT
jgi:hypothetical protein